MSLESFFEHLKAMGNLEGKATDYPVMMIIYLGAFILCTIASVALLISKQGKRIIWLPDQHIKIKKFY